jgi:hypothetical protein
MNAHSNARSEQRADAGYKAYTEEYARTQNVLRAMNAQERAYAQFNKDYPMGGKRSKRKTLKRKTHRRGKSRRHRKH